MRRFVGVALLALALLQLGFRGMQRVRSDLPLWDFASVYSAARTWLHGGNPYDLNSVVGTWRETGVFSDRPVGCWVTVYPPTSLAMLAPLAMLPAGSAMLLWLGLMAALLILQFIALLDLTQLRWRDPRCLILIAASFAAAPLQFGILSGQLSLPAISLCIIAFSCARRQREALGGVLLGLACALKPQIAAPFLLYYLLLRRRNISDFAILIAAGIAVIALAAMQLSHINWLAGWTQSIAASSQVGGVNDYGWSAPFRDEIVDLKMLLVSLPHDPLVLRIVIECLAVALLVWYVRAFPRASQRGPDNPRSELLALAALAALSLLPVYHRVYDAALLTTALAWALSELDGHRRRFALVLMIAMLPFLIPFDIMQSVGYRVPALFAIAQSWWWQSLIAPHYAWGLLALTIGLLATMSRQAVARPTTEPVPAGVLATDADDEDAMLAH